MVYICVPIAVVMYVPTFKSSEMLSCVHWRGDIPGVLYLQRVGYRKTLWCKTSLVCCTKQQYVILS